MQTSLLLAKFFGLYLLVAGLLWLIRGKSFDRMVEAFLDDPGFVALSGFIALIMGLAIITAHNVWEANWRVVITIFGYLAAAKGVWRLGWPEQSMGAVRVMLRNPARNVLVVLCLGLGAWLAWIGFSTVR